MNNEQRKQIETLNRRYFTEFGVAPDGRLKYQWMRTDEMPIEFARETESNFDAETGLWLATKTYKRRTFAETYGQGLCWTIAYLEPPISLDLWLARHGTDIPWPSNGYYRPVDNISLHVDCLPGEEESLRASYNIRCALELIAKGQEAAFKDELAATRAAREKTDNDLRNEVSDMVDDAAPAFMNNPGGKSHVSLPS